MNTKLILLSFLFLFAVTSCFKDQGNYDYEDINEVDIGALGGPYTMFFKADTLRITPDLKFTMDTNDPDRYRYEWRVGHREEGKTRQVIGTERNLNFHVSLQPGEYTIYYNVYDKVTEVTWLATTLLHVSTEVTRGFLITGEDEQGYADVDMVKMSVEDTIILKALLKDNGMPRYRKPIRALHTGSTSDKNRVKLWVMSEEGAYYVNTETFLTKPSNTFKNMLFTNFDLPLDIYPVDVAPRVYLASGQSTGTFNRFILTNTGDVFYATLLNGDIYGNPVNRVSSDPLKLFRCAPYFMYSPVRIDRYLVFDEVNNRFVRGQGSSTMLTVMGDAGGPFPWNQGTNGRKLHYAENTKNFDDGGSMGNSYALMKDNQNEFHIYKFYVNGTFNPVKLGYFKIRELAEGFGQATNYSFASKRPMLFYSVGSKLYGYDYTTGFEKNYLVKDFGEEITMLSCDTQEGVGNQLYVATYSAANKGTIRKFSIGMDMNTLTMTADDKVQWTGLLKVKAMDWKNSTQ